MQKEYVIQFYETINKLLCNLSFAGQYTMKLDLFFIDIIINEIVHDNFKVRGNDDICEHVFFPKKLHF